jgi:chlorophyllide a reductase subunit X
MTPPAETVSIPIEKLKRSLRAEAAVEPTPVAPAAVTRETQIIAIYGKGGIGKSFTLANLSYMMAQQGKKILLIGCDPKSDTTSLLFGGRACPTIIETSSRKKLAGEQVEIGDVCFKRDGVFAMELGGPEVGRGCGGRGIIHGFETLEKLGFHDWGFDYVLLDFLGDVVCGGFGLPIARDMCQKVIVVGSNDLQSLYVANNVCSAVEYFRKLGGGPGVCRSGRHPGARCDSRKRRNPSQERQLRNHWPTREHLGSAVRATGGKRRDSASRATQTAVTGWTAWSIQG